VFSSWHLAAHCACLARPLTLVVVCPCTDCVPADRHHVQLRHAHHCHFLPSGNQRCSQLMFADVVTGSTHFLLASAGCGFSCCAAKPDVAERLGVVAVCLLHSGNARRVDPGALAICLRVAGLLAFCLLLSRPCFALRVGSATMLKQHPPETARSLVGHYFALFPLRCAAGRVLLALLHAIGYGRWGHRAAPHGRWRGGDRRCRWRRQHGRHAVCELEQPAGHQGQCCATLAVVNLDVLRLAETYRSRSPAFVLCRVRSR
jgi:hypothetical protein